MDSRKKKKRGLDYWIAAFLLILMVVVVMIQVCTRMAGRPIQWGEEVARWLLIWIVFVGLGYAFRDGGLISVDFFTKKFRPGTQKKIHYFNMVMTIAYFTVLFVSAVYYFAMVHNRGQVYPITGMPATFTILAMLTGSVLAVIYAVKQIGVIRHTDQEGKGGEKE
ncbi:TRAP transporter small permease [Bacilliculturomica massiliensis]|uniref:TRAP transporter small permease n=1 Tax=Bacilliculturomica massiliensis TaxID=1917867 RepID=UPI0013EF0347|nr:TRAP transporter small permease [Bacilliculturomica massiliensis]